MSAAYREWLKKRMALYEKQRALDKEHQEKQLALNEEHKILLSQEPPREE